MKLFRGLLVSCNRNFENQCMSEMIYTLVERLGNPRKFVKAYKTGLAGLITMKIDDTIDLTSLIQNLKEIEDKEAYYVYTLKIKPINRICEADYEIMKEEIPEEVEKMTGTYRISVKKRYSSLKSDVLIDAAASLIDNKVDLTGFQWELMIEVVGNLLGLSAIKREGTISTLKSKEIRDVDLWFLDE